ncbi:unnamed protein product [Owenia fusiformis]|nr:unnamed protein product [Owenia fusiformis]
MDTPDLIDANGDHAQANSDADGDHAQTNSDAPTASTSTVDGAASKTTTIGAKDIGQIVGPPHQQVIVFGQDQNKKQKITLTSEQIRALAHRAHSAKRQTLVILPTDKQEQELDTTTEALKLAEPNQEIIVIKDAEPTLDMGKDKLGQSKDNKGSKVGTPITIKVDSKSGFAEINATGPKTRLSTAKKTNTTGEPSPVTTSLERKSAQMNKQKDGSGDHIEAVRKEEDTNPLLEAVKLRPRSAHSKVESEENPSKRYRTRSGKAGPNPNGSNTLTSGNKNIATPDERKEKTIVQKKSIEPRVLRKRNEPPSPVEDADSSGAKKDVDLSETSTKRTIHVVQVTPVGKKKRTAKKDQESPSTVEDVDSVCAKKEIDVTETSRTIHVVQLPPVEKKVTKQAAKKDQESTPRVPDKEEPVKKISKMTPQKPKQGLKCKKCGEEFTNANGYMKHITSDKVCSYDMTVVPSRYTCPHCVGVSFDNKVTYNQHLAYHQKEDSGKRVKRQGRYKKEKVTASIVVEVINDGNQNKADSMNTSINPITPKSKNVNTTNNTDAHELQRKSTRKRSKKVDDDFEFEEYELEENDDEIVEEIEYTFEIRENTDDMESEENDDKGDDNNQDEMDPESNDKLGPFKKTKARKILEKAAKAPANQDEFGRKYSCKECGEYFENTQLLSLHRRSESHDGFKPFNCPYGDCDFKTAAVIDLNKHINRLHTGEDALVSKSTNASKCKFCDQYFATKLTLKQHQTDGVCKNAQDGLYKGKSYTKTINTKVFSENDWMKPCNFDVRCVDVDCSLMFSSQDAVDSHIANHETEQHLHCILCGAVQKSLEEHNNHIIQQHKYLFQLELSNNSDDYIEFEPPEDAAQNVEETGKQDNVAADGEENTDNVIKNPEIADYSPDDVTGSRFQNVKGPSMLKKMFQCPESYCSASFQTKERLLYHLHSKSHGGKVPYKCYDCFKIFGSLSVTVSHYDTHHYEENTAACPVCAIPARRMLYINEHLRNHHKVNLRVTIQDSEKNLGPSELPTYICGDCGKGYQSLSKVRFHQHSDSHGGLVPFLCEVDGCEESFGSKRALAQHVDQFHRIRPMFPCPECDVDFTSLVQVNRHLTDVHGKCAKMKKEEFDMYYQGSLGELKCQTCDEGFNTRRELSEHRHMLSHDGREPYICESLLERVTPEPTNGQETGVDKMPVIELKCGAKFGSKAQLDSHITTHTGIPQYNCNKCSVVFTSKNALARHAGVHSTKDKHFCSFCDKVFSSTGTLRVHMNIHLGMKLDCEVCGKQFNQKPNLIAHARSHTGEKPYKCHFCDFAAANRTNFKRHLERKHTHRQRQYACSVCNMAFYELNTLKEHTLIHQSIRPFQCELCSRAFTQRSTLARHKKSGTCNRPKSRKFLVSSSALEEAVKSSLGHKIKGLPPGVQVRIQDDNTGMGILTDKDGAPVVTSDGKTPQYVMVIQEPNSSKEGDQENPNEEDMEVEHVEGLTVPEHMLITEPPKQAKSGISGIKHQIPLQLDTSEHHGGLIVDENSIPQGINIPGIQFHKGSDGRIYVLGASQQASGAPVVDIEQQSGKAESQITFTNLAQSSQQQDGEIRGYTIVERAEDNPAGEEDGETQIAYVSEDGQIVIQQSTSEDSSQGLQQMEVQEVAMETQADEAAMETPDEHIVMKTTNDEQVPIIIAETVDEGGDAIEGSDSVAPEVTDNTTTTLRDLNDETSIEIARIISEMGTVENSN